MQFETRLLKLETANVKTEMLYYPIYPSSNVRNNTIVFMYMHVRNKIIYTLPPRHFMTFLHHV